MSGNNLARMLALFVALSVLGGCSGTTHLGKVGDRDFYSIHASHLDGPNMTALVSVSENGETRVEGLSSGQGMLTGSVNAALGAGGNVASAALIANGIRNAKPARTNVNNSANTASSAGAESNSDSQGGDGGSGGAGGGGGGGGSNDGDDDGGSDDGDDDGGGGGGDGGHGGGDDNDDNGHGNDDDHDDDSNPGGGGGGHGGGEDDD